MQTFFQELKRRKVFRVATIYAVAAWPLVQLADLFFPAFGLPEQAMTYLLVAFVSGFPIALILSWIFNLTSHGIVLESATSTTDDEVGRTRHDWVVVAALITLMLVLFVIFSTQVSFEDNSSKPSSLSAELLSNLDNNAIAVLPFQIFSPDKNKRYFADGLTDELSQTLSRIPGLRVAARTSTFAYLDSGKSIPEIGSELNVGKIIEGTVRHNDVDNRIRISASLIDVVTGTQLWSKSFEREFTDLFRIQQEISEVVAKQMKLKYAVKDKKYIKNTPSNIDALVAYSAGQSELQKRTTPTLKSALSWFQRAVELDPAYAPAYIGIANSANLIFIYGGSSREDADKISAPAIAKAMAINPESAELYAAQGLSIWRDDAEKAAEFFKLAIAVNSNYASAYNWYGSVLKTLGKLEEALIYYEKAYQLDPRSTVAAHNLAQSFFDLARDKDALRIIDELIAMDPYYPGAFNLIGNLYLKRGRLDAAVLQFRKSLELAPSNKAGAFGLFNALVELKERKLADAAFQNLQTVGDMSIGSEWRAILNIVEARKELTLGNVELGVSKFEQALPSLEGKPQYNFVVAEKGYFSEDYKLALTTYQQIEKASKKLGIDIYSGEHGIGIHYAYALIQTGEKKAAEEVIKKILEEVDKPWRKKRQYPSDFFMLSQISMVENKVDEALLYLKLAINAGWTSTWVLEIDPAWKNLLQDERFLSLKQRVEVRLASMRNRLSRSGSFSRTSFETLLR